MKIIQAVAITVVATTVSFGALAGGMPMEGAEGNGNGGGMGDKPKHDSHWTSPEAAAQRVNPIERSAGSVSRGAALFAGNCAACHGQNATGDGPAGLALNPKPPNLRKMSGIHPDGDFAWKIANGRGAMPAWKNSLRKDQIWDVTNYIQSLSEVKYSQDNEAEEQQKVLSDEKHGHDGTT